MNSHGRVASRMLIVILIGMMGLAGGIIVVLPDVASAHAPHDDIVQVLASPTYASDRTAFAISRGFLMRSIDGGSTWQQLVNGLDRPRPNQIAIAPSDPQVLYVAAPGGGFYRSGDQGSSWTRMSTPVEARDIARLAVSPASSNVVFAAGTSAGLFRTTNGGSSWVAVGSFGRVTAVVFSASRLVVGDATGAVYGSTDNGGTWVPATGTVAGDMVTDAAALVPPATDGSVFVGTQSGRLIRSTDRGVSFAAVGSGLPAEQITGIVLSNTYANDGTLWLTVWNSGVYRSTNHGATFSPASAGLATDPQAVTEGRPQFGGVTAALAPNGLQVLFVAGFEGLFRSDDGGGHWSEIQTHADYVVGLAVSPDYENDAAAIVTTYVKGTYMTNDGGARWVESNVLLDTSWTGNDFAPVARLGNVHYSPDYVHDGTIFSASTILMFKSTDRGTSWRKIVVGDYPLSTYRAFITAVSPAYAEDQTVYVGTRQGDIYRSVSGGEAGTWSLLSNVGAPVLSLVLSPQFPAEPVVYASTSSGIFKSDDAGAHWQPTGPGGHPMLAISSDHSSDGTVFAGTDSGVFVTRDEGTTWTELIAAPLSTSTNVEAIAVSPNYGADHTVLVSVLGKGLYRSTDGGTTFAAVGTSLIQNNHLITDYEQPVADPIQFSPTYARDRTIFGMAQDDIVRSTDGGDNWQVLSLPPAADFLKPPVVAGAAAPAAAEGAGGTTRVIRIPFDLTHPYASTVTVKWQTTDVPGNPIVASSAAGDYLAASGTLTFAKGWTRQYANVVVNGDAIDEPDEVIVIALREPTNASIGGFWGLGFGTITDDDS